MHIYVLLYIILCIIKCEILDLYNVHLILCLYNLIFFIFNDRVIANTYIIYVHIMLLTCTKNLFYSNSSEREYL